MSNYDDNNRGQIWKNDDKQNDKHPDFKGSLNIDGVEYWVSAWKRREGANPKAPALTFRIKQKDQLGHRKSENSGGDDMDDRIPF